MEVVRNGLIFDAQPAPLEQHVCFYATLLRLSSGKILIGFRRGSTKFSADGNCCLAESSNEGESWEVVYECFENELNGAHGEVHSIALAESDDGTLLAFLTWVDRSAGEEYYNSESDTSPPSKVLLTSSVDGGKTWSSYTVLDTGPWQHPKLSGPAVRIGRDRWLVSYETQEPQTPGGPSLPSAHSLLVRDCGKAEKTVQVARDPLDKLFFYDQRQTLCPVANRLVAAFWTYDRQAEKDIDIHIARCDPAKLQWEQPISTGIAGQIAQPIPLPDGRLALFYVRRDIPGSMRLACSTDLGKTWSKSDELVVYSKGGPRESATQAEGSYATFWEDISKWTFGHPAGVLLDDNTILLAYYAGPDEKCLSIHWSKVRL